MTGPGAAWQLEALRQDRCLQHLRGRSAACAAPSCCTQCCAAACWVAAPSSRLPSPRGPGTAAPEATPHPQQAPTSMSCPISVRLECSASSASIQPAACSSALPLCARSHLGSVDPPTRALPSRRPPAVPTLLTLHPAHQGWAACVRQLASSSRIPCRRLRVASGARSPCPTTHVRNVMKGTARGV